MSQHDFSIANQLFPATRTDINNALAALASLSSGASAPSSPTTSQFWLDNSASPWILKIYDGADWVEVGEIDAGANTFQPYGGSAVFSDPILDKAAPGAIGGTTPAAVSLTTLNDHTPGAVGLDLLEAGTTGAAQTTLGITAFAQTLLDAESASAARLTLSAMSRNADQTSSEQTVSVDTLLSITHGLGARPRLVQLVLRCQTGDLGYSNSEEVIMPQGTGNSTDVGVSYSADSTSVHVIQGSAIRILGKSTFNYASITPANWRWVLRAWE